jgi:hypothetical protein
VRDTCTHASHCAVRSTPPHEDRQLLHEDKDAAAAAALAARAGSLSREDLVFTAGAAAAALGREQRRNAELVHRLQQMHAEQVAAATGNGRAGVCD